MARTVLITGVAGFLGRYVARQFARDGWSVVGVDTAPPENAGLGPGARYRRMVLPSVDLRPLLADVAPDACVHCAGRASVALSITEPAADFRDNVALTFELLEALRCTAPHCRFLFLSSAAVYGDPVSLPVTEEHACAPLSPYGWHKRQCELLCEEFARIYRLPTAVVRIFSAYGPGLRRQVIWDICAKALTNPALELRGTGDESRDFIHAADVARALAVLADNAAFTGEIYNLASSEETTISHLAKHLLALVRRDIPITFDGARSAGDPLHWRADITRLRRLGFAPEISLEQGARSVAAWCSAELGQTQ